MRDRQTNGQTDGRIDGQTDKSDYTGRCPTNVERPKNWEAQNREKIKTLNSIKFLHVIASKNCNS